MFDAYEDKICRLYIHGIGGDTMKNIIDRAMGYKYTSLEYVDAEDLEGASILFDMEEYIFIYKELENKIRIYWATASKEEFIIGFKKAIKILEEKYKKKIYIEFIPKDFIEILEDLGFKIVSEYVDFWNTDFSDIKPNSQNQYCVETIKPNEYHAAGEVLRDCKGYSRGFSGESDEWVKEWNESDNFSILTAKIDGKITGVCCVGLYGFESEKGTVLWIREIAVAPSYHGKGVGRCLLENAMLWGIKNGAKRSFLACDTDNYNAIKLYENLGYRKNNGRGEIDMEN